VDNTEIDFRENQILATLKKSLPLRGRWHAEGVTDEGLEGVPLRFRQSLKTSTLRNLSG